MHKLEFEAVLVKLEDPRTWTYLVVSRAVRDVGRRSEEGGDPGKTDRQSAHRYLSR
jgi:hypothetical protein